MQDDIGNPPFVFFVVFRGDIKRVHNALSILNSRHQIGSLAAIAQHEFYEEEAHWKSESAVGLPLFLKHVKGQGFVRITAHAFQLRR